MINEDILQEQIIKQLKENCVFDLIVNTDEFINRPYEFSSGDSFPKFSINENIKRKYYGMAKHILDSLCGEVELINGEKIVDISKKKTEILKPDMIFYNYETSQYLIMELKRDRNAERQAVTELLSYQMELKNYLPYISNYDLPLIVVSTEFRPMLLHSVASLILNNIPVLCLKPCVEKDQFLNFEVIGVDVWSNLKFDEISGKTFEGYSICLYGKDEGDFITNEEVINDMRCAVDYIKRDGERIGSHGFCVASSNFTQKGVSSIMSTEYFISYFCINPFSFYYNIIEENTIAKHMRKEIIDSGLDFGSFFILQTLPEKAKQFLKLKYTPDYENHNPYDIYSEHIFPGRKIHFCDAWGDVFDYMSDFYYSPYSKEQGIYKRNSNFNEPEIFLKILDGYMLSN